MKAYVPKKFRCPLRPRSLWAKRNSTFGAFGGEGVRWAALRFRQWRRARLALLSCIPVFWDTSAAASMRPALTVPILLIVNDAPVSSGDCKQSYIGLYLGCT